MRGNLYQLLANPIYIGKVGYKGEVYPGLHAPIVDPEVWGAVQALRSTRAPNRGSPCNTISPSLLVGLIYDESGDRLSPSHAVKAGVRYRYYISRRLMLSTKNASGGWRLPARELEDQVLGAVCDILEDDLKLANLLSLRGVSPSALRAIAAAARRLGQDLQTAPLIDRKRLLQQFVHRIEMHPDRLALSIDQTKLVRRIGGNQVDLLHPASTEAVEMGDEAGEALAINSANHIVTIDLSHQMKRRGVEAKIILGESGSRAPHHDQGLDRLAHLVEVEIAAAGTEHNGEERIVQADEPENGIGHDKGQNANDCRIAHQGELLDFDQDLLVKAILHDRRFFQIVEFDLSP
jgi:hypothetical protein